ncbi:MAG: hypothetical protein ABI639_04195 [Thermoanaerobaculia bacterium]
MPDRDPHPLSSADAETATGDLTPESRTLGALSSSVRSIAHDINGSLNNLSLNIELLERSSRNSCGTELELASRERSLASLRRAMGQIREVVEQRLLPLGRAPEADSGG